MKIFPIDFCSHFSQTSSYINPTLNKNNINTANAAAYIILLATND